MPQQAGSRRGGGHQLQGACFCVPPPLTFVLEDVLRVGQHAGEGATQKQPEACGPHEQEDDIVGENKQEQECHHHAHLSQQRQMQLEGAQGILEEGIDQPGRSICTGPRRMVWPMRHPVVSLIPAPFLIQDLHREVSPTATTPSHPQHWGNAGNRFCWPPESSMNPGYQHSPSCWWRWANAPLLCEMSFSFPDTRVPGSRVRKALSRQDGWWTLGPQPLGMQHKHPGGSIAVETSSVPPRFLLNPTAGANNWVAQTACSEILVAQPGLCPTGRVLLKSPSFYALSKCFYVNVE